MSANASEVVKELYEFGPFRVDPEKQILLRDDKPVPLTPKTFQILLVLVRHSQEVVTKDDLMKTVWPDTFVEEANLSRNIFMLRKALGDSPQDHRYIVTVPGRGYRLTESVRVLPKQEFTIVTATQSRVQVQIKETTSWAWVVAGALALFALALGTYPFLSRSKPLLSTKDTVVLADFSNSTGDAVFDETLRQGLAIELEQSPFLSIIPDERVKQTLRSMGSANARLTPEVAREVCERTGSVAVLNGSISSLGSEYVLGFRAKNCRTGNILDDEQVQAQRKEDVLNALGRIANQFRKKVGESLTTLEKYDTPLADATTPSLEALKAYSTGLKVLYSTGSSAALPFFQEAIEIDPKFAMGHAWLGRMYGDLGEFDLSAESTSRAYDLRDRTSDRERFFITASYDLQVTGNLEKAQQVCETWTQVYPRDELPHAMLSGIIYPGFGNYDLAAREGSKVIELDPGFAVGYLITTFAYQELNRLSDAENSLRRAYERKLEMPDFLVERFDIAFLKNDDKEMDRLAALGDRESGTEAWITDHEAFVYAYHGRLQEALKAAKRAEELAQQTGKSETAAQFEAGAAIWQALYGEAEGAKQSAAAALNLSRDRDVEYGASLTFALANDLARSQELANDLENRFPEDTSAKFSYLPSLRALFALAHKEPWKAIDYLQIVGPYELGSPRSSQHGFFGALYPIYIRGQAYLATNRGPEAVAEFQKIMDHRGIVVSDPVGALAHLQIGRAYSMAGDRRKARAAYEEFLSLWKHGDPDTPVLKEAKAEYTALK